jgi:hypothetical protein
MRLIIYIFYNYSQVITLFLCFLKMEDMISWMYGSYRHSQAYRDEVDNFIIVAVKHANTLPGTNDSVIYPCKDCKNHMAFYDVEIIRSRLIRRGFIPDYTVWTHHGEVMVVDDNDDHEEEDAEALQYLSQCSAALEAQMQRQESANEQARGDDAVLTVPPHCKGGSKHQPPLQWTTVRAARFEPSLQRNPL